jgi:hypothetical protein
MDDNPLRALLQANAFVRAAATLSANRVLREATRIARAARIATDLTGQRWGGTIEDLTNAVNDVERLDAYAVFAPTF